MGKTINIISTLVSLSLVSILLSSSAYATLTVTAHPVGNLPGVLVESSALDFNGGQHFWSLNDSGDPIIYKVAEDGSLVQSVNVLNSNCRNWEDLAHDSARNYMFVGDFGNNGCDRTNLRIFKFPYPHTGTIDVTAQEIKFSYCDQARIPSPWMNFDSEAFLHYHGYLYIFTKSDGSAIGYTKMYRVPDQAGTWVATLVDSFYTNDRTTSADISPDGASMVLISNTHIHLFRGFSGGNFFNGTHVQLNVAGAWTQKEAVCFSTTQEIYLSDENTGNGNHLYTVDLSAWIPPPPPPPPVVIYTNIEEGNYPKVSVYPNPASQYINIASKDGEEIDLNFSLYDITGRMIYETKIASLTSQFRIDVSEFKTGIYFYKVSSESKEIKTSRLIINH